MAFVPISGKQSQIRFGSYVFYGKAWTIEFLTTQLDTTNFEGQGWGQAIGGILEGNATIEDSDWNYGSSPFANPPNLVPGQNVAATFYINGVAGSSWVFSTALVVSVAVASKVRDTVKIPSIKLYSNQIAFTYPQSS